MQRDAIQKLIEWKNSQGRKPLIIKGARQTGKTWLMREFGRLYYKETIYINFENEARFRSLFSNDFNISRIISTLQLHYGKLIIPEDTLIIFDEIQSVEGGISSLKYFYEDAPQYSIIAAGSLLGISIHENQSFPVGKVSFLDLHPLSFGEFLKANNKELLLQSMMRHEWDLIRVFHEELMSLLRTYLFVGGMPEVVQRWINTHDYRSVRDKQSEILQSYAGDFSKHVPLQQIPRLNMVWDSLPAQLSKENKKFVYNILREGARAKDFELAIMWLYNCGLVLKLHRVKSPQMPLKAYHDMQVFKLFMVDVGLLTASMGLDEKTLLEENKILTEFKGALTEQYVMQELTTINTDYIGYWTNERSTSEVDFIIQREGEIIPIEVKSGENLHARSFTLFCEKYQPNKAIKTSPLPYHDNGKVINIPLYGIACL